MFWRPHRPEYGRFWQAKPLESSAEDSFGSGGRQSQRRSPSRGRGIPATEVAARCLAPRSMLGVNDRPDYGRFRQGKLATSLPRKTPSPDSPSSATRFRGHEVCRAGVGPVSLLFGLIAYGVVRFAEHPARGRLSQRLALCVPIPRVSPRSRGRGTSLTPPT